MRQKRYLSYSIIFGLLALFCATVLLQSCTADMTMKPWSEQTPKDRLVWMTGIYNAQDRDYRSMSAQAFLTDAQKTILRQKKEIMSKVYPLIDAYRITVTQGGTPDSNTEQAILNLLNQLQSLAMSSVEGLCEDQKVDLMLDGVANYLTNRRGENFESETIKGGVGCPTLAENDEVIILTERR